MNKLDNVATIKSLKENKNSEMLLNCVENLSGLSLIYSVLIVISTPSHNTGILTIVF